MTALKFLAAWFAVSAFVAPIVGRMLARNLADYADSLDKTHW